MFLDPLTTTTSDFRDCLDASNIDITLWNGQGTKTFHDLWNEFQNGFCRVSFQEGLGKKEPCHMERYVDTVAIFLLHYGIREGGRAKGGTLRMLTENRRVIGPYEFPPRPTYSATEKLISSEVANPAAVRATAERCLRGKLSVKARCIFTGSDHGEADIGDALTAVRMSKRTTSPVLARLSCFNEEEPNDDESFPGLPSLREMHCFVALVSERLASYVPCIRNFNGKVITYDWQKVRPSADPRRHGFDHE